MNRDVTLPGWRWSRDYRQEEAFHPPRSDRDRAIPLASGNSTTMHKVGRDEEAFSKVKQALRRAKPRTDDDLRAATWSAFATITPRDAAGWFTHCGYRVQAQSL